MQDIASIAVPTYNQEKYIVDCLESIYYQTYPEIELLIADDCSRDKTLDIILKWAEKHKERFLRCKVFENQKNLGISRNSNLLLREAKGAFIKLLAGDDILLNDAIEKEIEFFQADLKNDLVYANAIIIGENDTYPLKNIREHKFFYKNIPYYKDGIAEALFKGDVIAAPTIMLRKETIEQFGFYREDLVFEDWEYWLRIATGGGNIGYLDYPVVAYRILERSASHFSSGEEEEKRFVKNLESEEKLLNDYKSKIKNNSMDEFWNIRLHIAINNGYGSAITKILKTKKFKLRYNGIIALILYRLHLYKFIKKIYLSLKHLKDR